MTKLLSIIIPVFNTEKYLHRCLDSITNQDIEDVEIILIDDGSTDNSAIICDEYQTNYNNFKVIHTNNSGPATAKNIGLNIANGEYIWFVDSDDQLVENSIFTLYNYAKANNADIICFSYIEIDDNNNQSHTDFTNNKWTLTNEKAIRLLLGKNKIYSQCWTKLYKRSSIIDNNIEFVAGLKTEEDFLFNLNCLMKFKYIMLFDSPFYIYTYRNNSLSRKYYKENINEFLSNMCFRLNYTQKCISFLSKELYKPCIIHSLQYYNMMIGRCKYSKYKDCQPYYNDALSYIKKHPIIAINNKSKMGLSMIGISLLLLLPKPLYFNYRKTKE